MGYAMIVICCLVEVIFIIFIIINYLEVRKFNKNGITIYGLVEEYKEGEIYKYGDEYKQEPDYLIMSIEIENKKYTVAPKIFYGFSRKKVKEKYQIGKKQRIKVLKIDSEDKYRAKILKENKENLPYTKTIGLMIGTIVTFIIFIPIIELAMFI